MRYKFDDPRTIEFNEHTKDRHLLKILGDWTINYILDNRHELLLSKKGYNQTEIADTLKISEPTVSRDLSYLKNQAKSNIKKYIDEKLLTRTLFYC